MELDFTKMHGAGNDFIFIDDLSDDIELSTEQVRFLCNRHFGIGADGIIFVRPSKHTDCAAYMHYINDDGSLAEMCGNGVRCFAKYLVDRGFVQAEDRFFIADTLAGKRPIRFEVDDQGLLVQASVDMGMPAFAPERIPTTLAASTTIHLADLDASQIAAESTIADQGDAQLAVVDVSIETTLGELDFTCVNMGNPHAVTFLDVGGNLDHVPETATTMGADISSINTTVVHPLSITSTSSKLSFLDFSEAGPILETNAVFPQKANIEFACVIDSGSGEHPAEIEMRVWERGVGETLACGTGTCATVVAAVITGRISVRKALVHLLGGDLFIEWADDNHVIMTGPASTVFEGTIEL